MAMSGRLLQSFGYGWGLLAVLLAGCGGSSTGPQASTIAEGTPVVQVLYEGKPLANVQVLLKPSKDAAVLTRGVSNRNGNAALADLPSPEPETYHVALESISDGGWILNSKVVSKFCDSLRLKPFEQQTQQVIELPARAVQPLGQSH